MIFSSNTTRIAVVVTALALPSANIAAESFYAISTPLRFESLTKTTAILRGILKDPSHVPGDGSPTGMFLIICRDGDIKNVSLSLDSKRLINMKSSKKGLVRIDVIYEKEDKREPKSMIGSTRVFSDKIISIENTSNLGTLKDTGSDRDLIFRSEESSPELQKQFVQSLLYRPKYLQFAINVHNNALKFEAQWTVQLQLKWDESANTGLKRFVRICRLR